MSKTWFKPIRRAAYFSDPHLMDQDSEDALVATPYTPVLEQASNLWGSKQPDGTHVLTLDIDHRCWVAPSSTPGHYHLFIDVPMEWEKYEKVLDALADAGIIGPWYARFSKERQETLVRQPGVDKHVR